MEEENAVAEDVPEELPPGWIEERLQVDRRRLEAMITGRMLQGTAMYLPNAQEFFQKVELLSEAKICWPSKLKIGAKTKKDPYVKILGTPNKVETAKQLIAATLQVKRDRVTLKVEIPHSAHSHIIGRGGRGSQAVMRATGCHVHFPDGNKYSEDSSKSDQVSIAGAATQSELARRMLREMSPVCISFDIPWFLPAPPQLPPPTPDLSVIVRKTGDCVFSCTVRGSAGQERAIETAVHHIAMAFHLPQDLPAMCRLVLEMRPQTLAILSAPEIAQRFEAMCTSLCVHFQIPRSDAGESVVCLTGPAGGVLKARKFVMGILPVSLQFEQLNAVPIDVSVIENEFQIAVQTKRKPMQSGEQVVFVLRGPEEAMVNLLQARERILGMEEHESPEDDYAFMKSTPEVPSPFSRSLVGRNATSDESRQNEPDAPLSPDPENSPIAHSLLTGAKQINNSPDLWTGKQETRRATREQMLLKANQVIYESIDTSVRYPTDLWAGYGFSSSLPADLLKGMLNLTASGDSPDGSQTPNLPGKGLASVREEDECSDLSASSSSLSARFASRAFQPPRNRTPGFSASTSIFESPIGSECVWDIQVFVDPAMVLAQLGYSEYLGALREQEIDMHAFLLLDEQALRDIGVATVGARKKIHHAILKLRESAKANGFAL